MTTDNREWLHKLCLHCPDDAFEEAFENLFADHNAEQRKRVINSYDSQPHLFDCIKYGKVKAFKVLLKHGAITSFPDVLAIIANDEVPTQLDASCLDACCHAKPSLEMLEAILEIGVDPNNADGVLTHPMRWFKDQPAHLELLFKYGSSIDACADNIREYFPSQERGTLEKINQTNRLYLANNIIQENEHLIKSANPRKLSL